MNDSGDISGIISKLTENPEMMKSLMGIAGNLMNSNNDNGGKSETAEKYENNRSAPRDKGYDRKEERHYEDIQQNHRKRGDDAENLIRLLLALKPYVGPDRCDKIDSIIKILKLVQLSEKTGLLKSLL